MVHIPSGTLECSYDGLSIDDFTSGASVYDKAVVQLPPEGTQCATVIAREYVGVMVKAHANGCVEIVGVPLDKGMHNRLYDSGWHDGYAQAGNDCKYANTLRNVDASVINARSLCECLYQYAYGQGKTDSNLDFNKALEYALAHHGK